MVGVVGDATASPSAEPAGSDRVETVTETGTNETTNSTTPPHKNPDTVSGDGDPGQVAGFLSGQLGEYLGDSTLNISNGQYEQARSILGDEYNQALEQYVEVAGDTDENSLTDSFRGVQNNTRELISLREEYDQTLAEYEAAVAAGNTSRARELARELATLADQIDGVAVRLDDQLTEIENATGQELDARDTVTTLRLTTTQSANEITDAQLVSTQIRASTNTSTLAFDSPAQIRGNLVTANGTPIANESVVLEVGTREYTVLTTSDGSFSLVYRPVRISQNATSVQVAYLPTENSPYLGANTTVAASLTAQTPATVSLTNQSYTVQYGRSFGVSGVITVGQNKTVSDLSVSATIAGRQVGTTTTQSNGSFTVIGQLPGPAFEPGQQTLRVTLPFEGLAVAGTTESVPIEIIPAPTRISVNATTAQGAGNEVTVQGNLSVQSGGQPGAQTVDVFIDGEEVGTAETTGAGSYETTVTAPAADSVSEATVSVRFNGRGTGLSPSEATATVTLGAGSATQSGARESATQSGLLASLGGWPILVTGGLLAGFALLMVLLISPDWLSRTDSTVDTTRTETTADTSEGTQATQSDIEVVPEETLPTDNPTAAVQIAYSRLRAALTEDIGDGTTDTHWEFYRRCKAQNVDSLAEIERITAVYEVATYAPTAVSQQDAKEVVDVVTEIIKNG